MNPFKVKCVKPISPIYKRNFEKNKYYFAYIEDFGETYWVFFDINNTSFGFRFYNFNHKNLSSIMLNFNDYFIGIKRERQLKLKKIK